MPFFDQTKCISYLFKIIFDLPLAVHLTQTPLCTKISIFFHVFQTFYRENLNNSTNIKEPEDANLFIPNFSTTNPVEIESNQDSVVSQWDKLSVAEEILEDSDEVFSEMKSVQMTPTRKVIGQLKSEKEESKKPESWAQAVQGLKSVPENCDENVENLNGPVWILPPEEDKPKKKKKKNKKVLKEA